MNLTVTEWKKISIFTNNILRSSIMKKSRRNRADENEKYSRKDDRVVYVLLFVLSAAQTTLLPSSCPHAATSSIDQESKIVQKRDEHQHLPRNAQENAPPVVKLPRHRHCRHLPPVVFASLLSLSTSSAAMAARSWIISNAWRLSCASSSCQTIVVFSAYQISFFYIVIYNLLLFSFFAVNNHHSSQTIV